MNDISYALSLIDAYGAGELSASEFLDRVTRLLRTL